MKTFFTMIAAAILLCGCHQEPIGKSAWQYIKIDVYTTAVPGYTPSGGFYFPELDGFGRKGWELVSATPVAKSGTTESIVLIFKRPAGVVQE